MTDTTAPRTAAREKGHEPGWHDGIAPVHDWTGECRVCLLIVRQREAIEPLLALVRAAQEAFVAAEFPHGTDMSTWSKAEVERFWIDADTRWMEARRTFLTLYAALPESVRAAARKPE